MISWTKFSPLVKSPHHVVKANNTFILLLLEKLLNIPLLFEASSYRTLLTSKLLDNTDTPNQDFHIIDSHQPLFKYV